MLRLYRGEIIAGRNDATVEHDQVILSRTDQHGLAAGANAVSGGGDYQANRNVTEQADFH